MFYDKIRKANSISSTGSVSKNRVLHELQDDRNENRGGTTIAEIARVTGLEELLERANFLYPAKSTELPYQIGLEEEDPFGGDDSGEEDPFTSDAEDGDFEDAFGSEDDSFGEDSTEDPFGGDSDDGGFDDSGFGDDPFGGDDDDGFGSDNPFGDDSDDDKEKKKKDTRPVLKRDDAKIEEYDLSAQVRKRYPRQFLQLRDIIDMNIVKIEAVISDNPEMEALLQALIEEYEKVKDAIDAFTEVIVDKTYEDIFSTYCQFHSLMMKYQEVFLDILKK